MIHAQRYLTKLVPRVTGNEVDTLLVSVVINLKESSS